MLGMKQAELAAKAGISKTGLINIERNERPQSLDSDRDHQSARGRRRRLRCRERTGRGRPTAKGFLGVTA
jgi:transcriptional regulator with XRE-family HTH domain